MNNALRYSLVVLLLLALVMARKYEEVLFYDPFLKYFHGRLGRVYYPDYDLSKVVYGIVFRYGLNTLISILIISLLFKNRYYTKIAAGVYVAFFLLLFPVYIYLVTHYFELGQNMGFYVRRFLIQPLLLLLLIPAFFYIKIERSKRS